MNKINWFVNQESLEVTYWNLTSLLFFWFVGCFVTRKIKLSGNKFNIPSIFFKIDRVIYSRGKVLWAVVIFVTYFGYRTVDEKYSGIRNEGDGVPSFFVWIDWSRDYLGYLSSILRENIFIYK